MGAVLSFLQQWSKSQDWSQQELAEFYRVESALVQAGFAVTTERGLSDEEDPWFVFCRADNEEVIAHFARINREYVVISSFHRGPVHGRDFRALVREVLDSHPLMTSMRRRQGQNVYLHPAALLAALVASAYVVSHEKYLPGENGQAHGHSKNSSTLSSLIEKFSLIAAAVFGATWIEHHSAAFLQLLENSWSSHGHSDEKVMHIAADASRAAAQDAIFQPVHNEFGAHRVASSSEVAPSASTHDAYDKSLVAPKPAASVTADKGGEGILASGGGSDPSGSQVTDGSHSDGGSNPSGAGSASFVMGAPLQTPADAGSQIPTAQSASSSALAASSDAFHVAVAEIGNSPVETVVLSTAAVPLNQALQQAFEQVGLGSSDLAINLPVDLTFNAHSQSATSQPDSLSESSSPSHAAQGSTSIGTVSSAVVTENSSVPAAPANIPTTIQAFSASAELQATQMVGEFLSETPSFEITLSGANVVIIDANIADAKLPNYGVLTWDMGDGSTLSIVGIIPHHSLTAIA